MKFRYFVLFLVLVALGIVVQQTARYLVLTQELTALNEESTRLALLIEKAMYEEASILQQLKQAELRYTKLRSLLPTELQEESVEQQVEQLAKKYQIKVLATKTAINSRPVYREATLDITLEATMTQANQFIKAIKSTPRIITVTTPEPLGKKNIHLTMTIYAQNPMVPEEFYLPRCIEMPGGIVLPPLQRPLEALYKDYGQHCRFVLNYGDLYLKQRRLLELQEENSQLQTLVTQLAKAR